MNLIRLILCYILICGCVNITFSQSNSGAVLVHYYGFDDLVTGSNATDLVGGATGIWNGDAGANISVPGIIGSASQTNDTDGGNGQEHYTISELSGLAGANSVTLSLWFKEDPANTGYNGLFTTRDATATGGFQGFVGIATFDNRIDWRLSGNYGYPDIVANEWNHVLMLWDGQNGTKTLYLNGEFLYRLTHANFYGEITNSGSWDIGNDVAVADREFTGAIDEVAVWNGLLEHEKIIQLYGGGTPAVTAAQLATTPIVKPAELVHYYSFDDLENGGNATDYIGRSSGTWDGDADANIAVSGVFGKASQTNDMDGGNHEEHYSTIDMKGLNGATGITISLWFNENMGPGSNSGYNGLLMTRNLVATGSLGSNMGIAAESGHIDWRVGGAGAEPNYIQNAWNHVVATWDGISGTKSLYLNGVLRGQNTSSDLEGKIIEGGSWDIGNDLALNGREFTGILDEVAIWNRPLSLDDVQTLYGNGNPTVTVAEFANWPGLGEINSVKDLFPYEFQQFPYDEEPLELDKRNALIAQGIPPEDIDFYGDIVVPDSHQGPSSRSRWGDVQPNDFGIDPISFDTTGLTMYDSLPENSYPRVFFSANDRQAHYDRLENTEAGQLAKAIVLGWSDWIKGVNNPNGFYHTYQPPGWTEPLSNNGRYKFFQGHRTGYDFYANGETIGTFDYSKLHFESYRAWVYQDNEAAKKAANVFETHLRERIKSDRDLGRTQFIHNLYVNLNYDLLYNAMTPAQRALARAVIVNSTYNLNQYGVFQVAEATRSNWAAFDYKWFSWNALDGGDYFNDLQYRGYVRGMRNFLTYDWFEDGATIEGMGKNMVGGRIIYAMHRRGENLAAHPHLQAHVREFMPHLITPWGKTYVSYDKLGGQRPLNANDYLPLKALYPNDSIVDWVYRNVVGENYENVYPNGRRIHNYWEFDYTYALFLQDHIPGNNDPAALGIDESYFSPLRGLSITRSSWDEDAALLHHHARARSFGHGGSDRQSIIFADKGRFWIEPSYSSARSWDFSYVKIDDWTPKHGLTPAKFIDYKKSDLATFSCADKTYCYNWKQSTSVELPPNYWEVPLDEALTHDWDVPEGWEKDLTSQNDYALFKSSRPSTDMPEYARGSWLAPDTPSFMLRKPVTDTPVKKAIRSAGLIRGEHPYAFIVDDYEADDDSLHTFTWSASIDDVIRGQDDDLVITNVEYDTLQCELPDGGYIDAPSNSAAPSLMTVHLEPISNASTPESNPLDADGNPKLVFRLIFLEQNGEITPENEPRIELVRSGTLGTFRTGLVSTEPQFKTILVVTRQTDGFEPIVTKTQEGAYRLILGNQEDLIYTEAREDGRTGLAIRRIEGEHSGDLFLFGMELNDCINIQLQAYLEGAYDTNTNQMTNALQSRGLLPGQTPNSNLVTPTPAGQPYNAAPWNYSGTEGAGWTDADYTGDETDWILISFRTGTAKSTEVAQTAALLMKDGTIELIDRCALSVSITEPLYVVLEHRNHIGIMTPQPIEIVNGVLTYDFRTSDSYRDPTSFGQKQLANGEWAMFAGDADQMDYPSFDVNGTDKTEWFDNNGVFDYYLSPDFNLDGDVNGQDKSLWFENNGISSRVPK